MRHRILGGALAAVAALAIATAGPAAQAAPPQLDARAWVLVDGRSGDVLAARSASRSLPVASTTKLMTAYVALKELAPGQIVRAAPYDALYAESLLELRTGQRVSVRDLLYGLILRSGNDAAYDLALAAAGSEAAFVRQMNARAAALGLLNTHYANPIGLDEPGNYSSAYDLAALARRLLDIPAFAEIADSRSAVLRSLRPPWRIRTRNDLLLMVPWVTGVKTGYTFGADYVLVASGRRKGTELISVVLGADSEADRDLESLKLLEYGFSLYRKRIPIRRGEALATPSIRYTGDRLPLRAPRLVAIGLRRGQRLDVAVRAPGEVEGPIRRGAVLGRATVLINGQRAGSVALRAGRAVGKASTLDRVRSFVEGNLLWLALALSGILVGAVFMRRLSR